MTYEINKTTERSPHKESHHEFEYQFTELDAQRHQGKTLSLNEQGKLCKKFADPAKNYIKKSTKVNRIEELYAYMTEDHNTHVIITGTNNNIEDGKLVRRTQEIFDNNGPGLIPIDGDELREICRQNNHTEFENLEDFVKVFRSLHPELKVCGIVATSSSSSFINVTGNRLEGAHLYLLTHDTSSNKKVLEILHQLAIANGYGRHLVSKAGKLLDRSIVDMALKTPNQPIFESSPITKDGIEAKREVKLFPGIPLDPNLITITDEEKSKAKEAINGWKSNPDVQKEMEKKFDGRIKELVTNGVKEKEARIKLESYRQNKPIDLGEQWPVLMDNGQTVTVGEILINPNKFHRLTCHDPMDPEYGPSKAKIYSNQEKPCINSYAHGDGIYFLHTASNLTEITAESFKNEQKPVSSAIRVFLKNEKDDRPWVVRFKERHKIVDQTLHLLPRVAKNLNIFSLGPTMVKVQFVINKDVEKEEWVISPINAKTLCVDIQREIAYLGTKVNKKDNYEIWIDNFPFSVAEYIMDGCQWRQGMQTLNTISQGPFITDQRVVTRSGLTEIEKDRFALVHHGTEGVKTGELSQENAKRAFHCFASLLDQFPYESQQEGVSAFLSMLLTFLAAPGNDKPVPGHIIHANERGAGKTHQVKIAYLIATGREPSPTSYTQDQTEMSKKILAKARTGNEILFFDNIKFQLGGQILESAMTTSKISDRILGYSEMVNLPYRPIVIGTANGATWSEDMARRLIHIRMYAEPNPEKRTFKINDILEHVLKERAKYLSAAFSILQGWAMSNDKAKGCKIGSFGKWSEVVRDAIIWAGGTDVVLTQDAVDADDKEDAHEFVQAIGILSKVEESKREKGGLLAKELELIADGGQWPSEGGSDEESDATHMIQSILKERGLLKASTIGSWLKAEVLNRKFGKYTLRRERTNRGMRFVVDNSDGVMNRR